MGHRISRRAADLLCWDTFGYCHFVTMERQEKVKRAPWRYHIAFLIVVAMLVLLLFGLAACNNGVPSANERTGISETKNSNFSQVVLEVATISCWTCESRVAASAKSVPGVKAVMVAGRRVTVTYNPVQTTLEAIVEAIEAGGDRVAKVTKL